MKLALSGGDVDSSLVIRGWILHSCNREFPMNLKLNFGNRRHRSAKPPKAKHAGRGGRGAGVFLILFGLIFTLAGSAFTWFMSVDVWKKSSDSRQWEEVSCVIVSSEVVRRSTSDGVNYRPGILFRYTWDGTEYESDSYRFMEVSSSNRGWAGEVVARYPAGSSHTALVNPRNPEEAVLDRRMGASFILTLLPLVFVLVGLGVVTGGVLTIRKKQTSASVRSGDSEAPRALRDASLLGLPEFPPEPPPGGTVPLKPVHSPLGKFVGLLIFALLWNGVIFLFLSVGGPLEPGGDIVPRLVLGLFALIGVGVFLGAVYSGVSFFFGPRIQVEADAATLNPGHPVKISWRFTRGSTGLRNLKIFLEGITEAEYTTGSGKNRSTVTNRKTFLRETLFQSDNRMELPHGDLEYQVPDSLPHSFEASKNRIRYTLHIQGDIPLMPNLKNEYRAYVPPRPIS